MSAASEPTMQWLRSYYEAMDGLRFDAVGQFLHDDCHNHYPTGAVLVGRDRILASARKYLGGLAGIQHELLGAWEEGDELIFELRVTYRRTDGLAIVRPGVGIFVVRGGRILEQRLFVDSSGVWD